MARDCDSFVGVPQIFPKRCLQRLATGLLQTFVIFSAPHTRPNRCLIFSFVHKVLGREDTLSTLLVINANLYIKVKQQIDLKTVADPDQAFGGQSIRAAKKVFTCF